MLEETTDYDALYRNFRWEVPQRFNIATVACDRHANGSDRLALIYVDEDRGTRKLSFDEIAAFQNFLIMPLTFLSGVFYSVHSLPPFWQAASHLNPFFYMVDGFRYGFFGQSDVSPWLSLGIVTAAWLVSAGVALQMLRTGYKLRA